MDQYYKIADLTIKMDTFGRTEQQAKPYLIKKPEKVDFEVISNWQERQKERPWVSDEMVEYLCSGSNFYKHLLEYNGFMLHASAVVVDGYAYLFSADSGTGKSTHTAIWLKEFGERAYILNDDKPAVRLVNGVWYAYGTPWSGKHDISTNMAAPIAGVAMLYRGRTNEIHRWKDAMCIALMKQVNRPKEKIYREKLLGLLDQFLQTIPVWKFACNMEKEAMKIAFDAMKPDDK